jgi:hypothetical protein
MTAATQEQNMNALDAMREAIDLLAERKHGNAARSQGHNARLVLEAALQQIVGALHDQAERQSVLDAFSPAQEPVAWPINTDDQVEALARECDWNNRRYMTPADYSGWCEQMRKFARLAAPPAPAPAQVAVKALEWPAHDLIPGRAYESQNWGTVKYAGLDTYHGETTHEFRGSMPCGGARYIKSEKLGDFLKPKIAALALAEGQAKEGMVLRVLDGDEFRTVANILPERFQVHRIVGNGAFADNRADALVREMFFNGSIHDWQMAIAGLGTITGAFQITSLEYPGGDDCGARFALALEGAGHSKFTPLAPAVQS